MTDPALRAGVAEAAARLGHGYRVVNGTNSGVVVYNNEFLKHARWADWMHALVNVSRRGFYGDQTALTVALGRADVPVRWLHPRFNVMVTLPYSYVLSSCGEDALYAGRAARRALLLRRRDGTAAERDGARERASRPPTVPPVRGADRGRRGALPWRHVVRPVR